MRIDTDLSTRETSFIRALKWMKDKEREREGREGEREGGSSLMLIITMVMEHIS